MVLRLATFLLGLGVAAVVGCGGDEPTETPPPPSDTEAPFLLSSSPTDGADGVDPASPIELLFNEPMNRTVGVVELADRTFGPGMGRWENPQAFTVSPSLEPGQTYEVALREFQDVAGNPLEETSFTFTTAGGDETAPRLVSTDPVDGADDVPATLALLTFTFNEAMDPDAGMIRVVRGPATPGSPRWTSDRRLEVPLAGVESEQTYGFALDGFVDVAGNALEVTDVLTDGTLDFTVPVEMDTTPPTVVASTPIEGSPAVDPAIASITLTFSEAMDQSRASAALTEGTATRMVGGIWNAPDTISFPVAGTLLPGTTYALRPMSFQDVAGNALDDSIYLGDGALDFTTDIPPDSDPPAATAATPADQATMVPTALSEITVTFDEPMDPSNPDVVIDITGGLTATSTTRTGLWTNGNRTFAINVAGLLMIGRTYRLDLTGLRDIAQNPLDPVPVLGDGILSFSTPPDVTGPAVVSTQPAEGAADVTPALGSIVVTFDEPVTTMSLVATLTDGTNSNMITPSYDPALSRAIYPVAGLIRPDRSYRLDLTGVRDLVANPLRQGPVLGDGVLNFSAPPPPSGFNCSAPLTEPYGQVITDGVGFTVASGTTGRNGSFLCDATDPGDDVVIQFDKRTGTAASGGRLLQIEAVANGSQGLNVEVLSGACTLGMASTRHKCFWNKDDVDVLLDVPAGRYWIWVSSANEGAGQGFPGATINVREVDPRDAEGEGCWLPYTTRSTPIYTPPAVPGGAETWSIPAADINSFDMDVTWGGSGSMTCDLDPVLGPIHGVDAVVEYTPSQVGSLLQIGAQSRTSMSPINLEVLDRCDPRSPSRRSFGCSANAERHDLVVTSTAPVYIWVAAESMSQDWPGVDVSVREVVPQVGETCATGRVISSPGVVAVPNVSSLRIGAPSCLRTAGSVEWFRYVVSGGRVQITSQSQVEIGVVYASGASAPACAADISALGLGTAVPVGTTLCIGVPVALGASDFELVDVPDSYTGVGTSTSAINVVPSAAWTPDAWMGASTDWIYFGRTSTDVQRFPKTVLTSTLTQSSTAATVLGAPGSLGYAGLVFPDERVFSLDDGSGSSTSRLFRIWDGAAASFSSEPWDLTPNYPAAAESRAMTFDGTGILLATHETGSVRIYLVLDRAAQSPIALGSNSTVEEVVGLAADAQFLYLVGRSVATGVTGIYRLGRADLGSPQVSAGLIQPLTFSTAEPHPAYLDDIFNPQYLYVRAGDPPAVFVIELPASVAPVRRGPLVVQGRVGDVAWTYDQVGRSIYYFETETSTTSGRLIWMR